MAPSKKLADINNSPAAKLLNEFYTSEKLRGYVLPENKKEKKAFFNSLKQHSIEITSAELSSLPNNKC